jgi:hypothetical protein
LPAAAEMRVAADFHLLLELGEVLEAAEVVQLLLRRDAARVREPRVLGPRQDLAGFIVVAAAAARGDERDQQEEGEPPHRGQGTYACPQLPQNGAPTRRGAAQCVQGAWTTRPQPSQRS